MTELHVVPDDHTTWRLYDAEERAPLSEHTNATDATRQAQAQAQDRGAGRVVVHDRYHRTHTADPPRDEGASGAHRARAHQPVPARPAG